MSHADISFPFIYILYRGLGVSLLQLWKESTLTTSNKFVNRPNYILFSIMQSWSSYRVWVEPTWREERSARCAGGRACNKTCSACMHSPCSYNTLGVSKWFTPSCVGGWVTSRLPLLPDCHVLCNVRLRPKKQMSMGCMRQKKRLFVEHVIRHSTFTWQHSDEW